MSIKFAANASVIDSETRSYALLIACLTPPQRLQWFAKRHLVVQGNMTGQKYLLEEAGPVFALSEDGTIIGYRCCVPLVMYMPPKDLLLGKKLLLENREDYFLERTFLTPYKRNE